MSQSARHRRRRGNCMQATTVSAVSPPSRPHHTEPHPVTLQALVADCLRSRGLSRRGTDHACRRRRGSCADPPTGVNCGNIAGLGRDIQRSSPTLNHSLPGGVTLSSQITVTRRRSNVGADQFCSCVQSAPAFLGGSSWLLCDRIKLECLSQAFRVASAQNPALTWLGGLFHYKEDGEGLTRLLHHGRYQRRPPCGRGQIGPS